MLCLCVVFFFFSGFNQTVLVLRYSAKTIKTDFNTLWDLFQFDVNYNDILIMVVLHIITHYSIYFNLI